MLHAITATRPRKTLLVLCLLALSAGVAIAAWFVYTGHQGSIGGKAGSSVTVGALTLVDAPNIIPDGDKLSPGTDGAAGFRVTNADATTAHTIASATLTGPVTSSPDTSCAGFVTATPGVLVGVNVAAGASSVPVTVPGFWHGAANLPLSCQEANFFVNVTGSTTP